MTDATAPTTRDFPLCASCGAAPTSRKEESCRFCGAVLPWADFDLRSRRRLVLESVPESTMDAALERVEASGAFRGARTERRRIGRRLREYRERRRAAAAQGNDAHGSRVLATALATPAGMGIVAGALLLLAILAATLDEERFAVAATGLFIPVVLALALVDPSRRLRRRRGGADGGKSRWATPMGILELGPPEFRGRLPRRHVRSVKARLTRQRTREFLADAALDLHAGDIGVARLSGKRLVALEVLEHIATDGAPCDDA